MNDYQQATSLGEKLGKGFVSDGTGISTFRASRLSWVTFMDPIDGTLIRLSPHNSTISPTNPEPVKTTTPHDEMVHYQPNYLSFRPLGHW